MCDLGCNSGDLTISLYDKFSKHYGNNSISMLGIDLDSDLIATAKKKMNAYNIPHNNKNASDNSSCSTIPIRNIEFKSFDMMSDDNCPLMEYDIISCFGLTMWIHVRFPCVAYFLSKYLTRYVILTYIICYISCLNMYFIN